MRHAATAEGLLPVFVFQVRHANLGNPGQRERGSVHSYHEEGRPATKPKTLLAGHIKTRMWHGVLSYQVSSPIGFSAALVVVSPIAV
jgi:hypothetical protein